MTPEMFRTPLHEIALSIKLLRLGAIGEFLSKAMQPPPIDSVVEAEVLLRGGWGLVEEGAAEVGGDVARRWQGCVAEVGGVCC